METKEVALSLRQAINCLSTGGDDFHPEMLNEFMRSFCRAADIIERLNGCYEIKAFDWMPHPYFTNRVQVQTPIGVYSVTQDGFKFLAALDENPITERDSALDAKEDCFINFQTKMKPSLRPLKGQTFN